MTAFTAGAASLVGKMPSQAEFVAIPSGVPGFSSFDGWLTEAIEWAAGRGGRSWLERFATGAIHAFVYRPPASEPDTLLCGALGPSRDSAGRQFPLAVAAPIHAAAELVERPHLLPFTLETFWAGATELLFNVIAGGSADPHGDCSRLGVEPAVDLAEADALYRQWAGELSLSELWSLLGPPLEGQDPSGALRLVLETVAPFRGVERPETPLSLRLPLGLAGGAALCFWLDLVCRAIGWRSTVPSLFWSHDGNWGAALLHLGRPPRQALAELWLPTGQREEICDLTAQPSPALLGALPELSPASSAALANPEARVVDLLEAVALARA